MSTRIPSRPLSKHTLQECRQVLTELNDYVDNTLPFEFCHDLEEHLARCENCRIVLDTLRKTIYLVHQISDSPVELPADVEQRLFAALRLDDYLPKDR